MNAFLSRARDFLAAAPGAVAGSLNAVELGRVIATAVFSGGGIYSILVATSAAAGTIFLDPTTAALASMILTAAAEAYRRLGHGDGKITGTFSYRAPR